ncbi:MAG: DUF3606 domain-containing protein [Phenylobacterium sp.]|uniref:DUF3606 domain-containing protein n=1 Tax=Phenylobacterium sp. TaxID=1871053 RepID=UPI001A2BB237|nr:DUF3606 domain-containing protein [Phenylobacterium sp.]MBJ7410107.1 DUF3606 domain-containing protein [Phenylobacterium sp.]
MRPDEARSFEDEHMPLDVCNEAQVREWAERYEVDPDVIREACQQVGPNRTAVELLLQAPRA